MNTRTLLTALIATSLMTAPASARQSCGWRPGTPGDGLPANVDTIVAQLPPAWKDASSVIANLRRWYRDCDGSAARQAIFDLTRANRNVSGDVAISALLGTALMHGPEVQMEGATGVTNRATFRLSNSERDGARLLLTAAKNPAFRVAAIELADVALGTRHEPTVKLAMEALQLAAANGGGGVYLRLLAELSLAMEDYAAARAHGEHAVQLGDTSGMHAAGIARIMMGDTTAAATYLRGLDHPGAIDLYYDDLSYLLQPADTVAWSKLAAAERAGWIRKQWVWRAATSSQSVGERLKVHFDRIAYALEYFPRTALRGAPNMNAVTYDARIRRMALEDRGLIYVRHGAPDDIVRTSTRSLDNLRLAWAYNRIGNGRALFEFTKKDCSVFPCGQWGDYYLATPLPCIGATRRQADDTFVDYGMSIGQRDPALAMYLITCGMGGGASDLRFLEQKQRSISDGMVALRTESAAPPLKDPLKVLIGTYAMRAAAGTEIFAFAAVPGETIHPRAGTSSYALRLLLSVEDPVRLRATTVDTALAFVTAAPMQAGQIVRASVSATSPPLADATIRFTIRNPNDSAQGQIITAARAIPDLTGFAMSDIVIAEPREGGWRRGSARLAPIPAHSIAANATFRLFYELYGAQEGDALAVEITIAPGTGSNILANIKSLISRGSARQIAFSDRARIEDGDVVRASRDITGDLEPGRYVVTVTVRNERTGGSASSTTELIVLKS